MRNRRTAHLRLESQAPEHRRPKFYALGGYSLVESCKLNHIDPQSYLQYVLERIADHPINLIEELLPWNVAEKLAQPSRVTDALAA